MPTNSRKHTRRIAEHGNHAVRTLKRDAVDAGREVVDSVRDQVNEAIDSSRSQLMEFTDCARDSIRSRPFQALAIAAGVGLFFGLAMRIKRRLL